MKRVLMVFCYSFPSQVLARASPKTGIAVFMQEDTYLSRHRNVFGKSESDIEFSSDCLPIKTDSSSILEMSSALEGEEELGREGEAVTLQIEENQEDEKVIDSRAASPMSPLTEIPPTPTLSNTLEHSESEGEEQEEPVNTSKTEDMAKPCKTEGEEGDGNPLSKETASSVRSKDREIDPVRIEGQ
jgi:hypothetical protein